MTFQPSSLRNGHFLLILKNVCFLWEVIQVKTGTALKESTCIQECIPAGEGRWGEGRLVKDWLRGSSYIETSWFIASCTSWSKLDLIHYGRPSEVKGRFMLGLEEDHKTWYFYVINQGPVRFHFRTIRTYAIKILSTSANILNSTISFFSNLLSIPSHPLDTIHPDIIPRLLMEKDYMTLNHLPFIHKIRKVIFSIDTESATSSNRLSSLLFSIVGILNKMMCIGESLISLKEVTCLVISLLPLLSCSRRMRISLNRWILDLSVYVRCSISLSPSSWTPDWVHYCHAFFSSTEWFYLWLPYYE